MSDSSPLKFKLTGSVGLRGRNLPKDILTVQKAINHHLSSFKTRIPKLAEDSTFGSNIRRSKTLAAILHYQKEVVKLNKQDGLVAVDGPTHRCFNGLTPFASTATLFKFHNTRYTLARPSMTLSACLATLPNNIRPELKVAATKVITEMYGYGIAMGCKDFNNTSLGYRNFHHQVWDATIHGPGESAHNFGLAVDIGVLEWVDVEGVHHVFDFDLFEMARMKDYSGLPEKIWHLRNTILPNKLFAYTGSAGLKQPMHMQMVKPDPKALFLYGLNTAVKGSQYRYRNGPRDTYEVRMSSGPWVNLGNARSIWLEEYSSPNISDIQRYFIHDHMKLFEFKARNMPVPTHLTLA
ncbi:hypothetical protein L4C36_15585 [Photobacterium japonica]|uniref:hypothetical protein n=1 Tax=Photobacterium japonica TaxID=2910235 RepID=UPI003D1155FF